MQPARLATKARLVVFVCLAIASPRLRAGEASGAGQADDAAPAVPANGDAQAASQRFALRSSAYNVVPSLRARGAGYFFRVDLPVAYDASTTTAGVGVYPFNIGRSFPSAALTSYLSLGGAASVGLSRGGAGQEGPTRLVGASVQTRAAVGARLIPARGWALSAEVGYSPWSTASGTAMDLSFALEWR